MMLEIKSKACDAFNYAILAYDALKYVVLSYVMLSSKKY